MRLVVQSEQRQVERIGRRIVLSEEMVLGGRDSRRKQPRWGREKL